MWAFCYGEGSSKNKGNSLKNQQQKNVSICKNVCLEEELIQFWWSKVYPETKCRQVEYVCVELTGSTDIEPQMIVVASCDRIFSTHDIQNITSLDRRG